jgi:hypothetical protein
LPAAVEHEPYNLTIPDAYILAVSAAIYAFYYSRNEEAQRVMVEIPPLQVLLEFEDIAGDMYRAPYAICLNVGMVGPNGFTARLESKAER